ncbi:hypothetical protein DRF65_06290 [Chryseobacterium pennae]|uniref:YD repeat-containing protein n=1 Tax=Chryseobacterium pennae TaxID=2258962 RepID=A0A3D9CBM0_9FLAO|nr:hypothetical protein [Chryseobacterium pennae]REC63260.1 hypothetical protein DRF65_06290 [Chryseobacterium pennae]
MKFKLICLVGILAITSCSNNNDEIQTETEQNSKQAITKISWAFPELLKSNNEYDPNYYFEYDILGRVTKKIGGKLYPSSSIIFPDQIVKFIYTKVSYNQNTAVVGTYSSDPILTVLADKRKFEFDTNGRIIKSIIPESNVVMEKHLRYSYDNSGKLVEILTEFPNMPYNPADPEDYIFSYLETFSYDVNGNLQKAITMERRNNIDFSIKKEMTFSNFDTTQNPFKKLRIFNEYFYLSLSKNNYQKSTTREFVGTNEYFHEFEGTYQYDAGGNIKLFF